MRLEKKLSLLRNIASDLQIIHSQNLINTDLHSGNILLNDLNHAYIADLGFSIPDNLTSTLKSDGILGILPYIDPEVLNGKSYTKKSDIYSFGIIMWEILYGKQVYSNDKSESQLQLLQFQIRFDGWHPHIPEDVTPPCYVDLMKKCWSREPEKRPSAEEICNIFTQWQNDKNILLELSKYNKKIRSQSSNDPKKHSDNMHTSKIIKQIMGEPNVNKQLDKIGSDDDFILPL
ncbi:kinase-like domain-containing protein [Gigaspora rosea]|uniref:Kinase-like domain-containing protein n=1 Tax=Gigaspora rosea TaxID=44941 RepID=A0A397V8Q2_9GLOM|nr:kinase-like domain-containing protein [Gigaspora rosea]